MQVVLRPPSGLHKHCRVALPGLSAFGHMYDYLRAKCQLMHKPAGGTGLLRRPQQHQAQRRRQACSLGKQRAGTCASARRPDASARPARVLRFCADSGEELRVTTWTLTGTRHAVRRMHMQAAHHDVRRMHLRLLVMQSGACTCRLLVMLSGACIHRLHGARCQVHAYAGCMAHAKSMSSAGLLVFGIAMAALSEVVEGRLPADSSLLPNFLYSAHAGLQSLWHSYGDAVSCTAALRTTSTSPADRLQRRTGVLASNLDVRRHLLCQLWPRRPAVTDAGL